MHVRMHECLLGNTFFLSYMREQRRRRQICVGDLSDCWMVIKRLKNLNLFLMCRIWLCYTWFLLFNDRIWIQCYADRSLCHTFLHVDFTLSPSCLWRAILNKRKQFLYFPFWQEKLKTDNALLSSSNQYLKTRRTVHRMAYMACSNEVIPDLAQCQNVATISRRPEIFAELSLGLTEGARFLTLSFAE